MRCCQYIINESIALSISSNRSRERERLRENYSRARVPVDSSVNTKIAFLKINERMVMKMKMTMKMTKEFLRLLHSQRITARKTERRKAYPRCDIDVHFHLV